MKLIADDRLSNLQHLLFADDPVVVNVVEGEGPRELVHGGALADHRKKFHEIAKSDPTGPFSEMNNRR